MADKATNGTEELLQAYNKAVASGLAAVDASVAQTTTTVKLVNEATQAERNEFGKVWEHGTDQARKRSENLAAVIPGMFQDIAAKPGSGVPTFGAASKESFGKLIESEMAFYQSWTQAWMQYIAGLEERRSAAVKAMLESNAKVMESSQHAVKDAVEYGGALVNWSMETINTKKG